MKADFTAQPSEAAISPRSERKRAASLPNLPKGSPANGKNSWPTPSPNSSSAQFLQVSAFAAADPASGDAPLTYDAAAGCVTTHYDTTMRTPVKMAKNVTSPQAGSSSMLARTLYVTVAWFCTDSDGWQDTMWKPKYRGATLPSWTVCLQTSAWLKCSPSVTSHWQGCVAIVMATLRPNGCLPAKRSHRC